MEAALLRWADEARHRELERALRLLGSGRDAVEVSRALSRRLTNKLLHAPTQALREGLTKEAACTSTS
jgi:glutamyl-tRNA reductase